MKRLVLLLGFVTTASVIAVLLKIGHKSDSNIMHASVDNIEDYLGV